MLILNTGSCEFCHIAKVISSPGTLTVQAQQSPEPPLDDSLFTQFSLQFACIQVNLQSHAQ